MTMESKFVSGVDSYNLCLTGDIGRTLATPSGGLNEHIPVVLGCDMYNFQITGEISSNLNASSCNSPTHSGPSLLIFNDQGGDIMNTSEDVTSTLRAQDHGHPPIVCFGECNNRSYVSEKTTTTIRAECHGAIPVVCLNFQGSKSNNVISDDGTVYSLNAMHGHDVHVVCFEPGILRRDCSAGNRAYVDVCSTLRAQMGDNQPAVAYAIDHVVTTGGNCTAQGPCWYENICPTEKASGVHAVCFQNTGHGWWNQDNIAQTLRTPCGGDSMKANLVLINDDTDGANTIQKECYSMSQRQISMMVGNNQTASLVSTDYKDPQIVCYEETHEQDKLPESVGHTEQTHCDS